MLNDQYYFTGTDGNMNPSRSLYVWIFLSLPVYKNYTPKSGTYLLRPLKSHVSTIYWMLSFPLLHFILVGKRSL